MKKNKPDGKILEAEALLVLLLNSKKADEAEAGCTEEKIIGDKVRGEVGDQNITDL